MLKPDRSPVYLASFIAAATLTAATAGVRAQGGQGRFDYHQITGEIVWRGTQALKLCNGLFVSGRTVDQIYGQEFAGMGTPMPRQRIEVDRQLKVVAIGTGDAGAGTDPVPVMRSAFREGIGCVVMAPDQTVADIDKLPMVRMPAPSGDPAAIPWPDGDRIENNGRKIAPEGVNESALKSAGDWAFDRVGHGGNLGQVTLSLMVVRGGAGVSDILYERYAPGVDMHTRTRTWSTAKSITSTLVGIAIGKGLLELDGPLPFDWRPEMKAEAPDPRRRITLRHLLNMSSGLYPVDNDYGDVIGSPLSYFGGWNSADHARDRGLIREPGTSWDYENYDTLLTVLALRSALRDETTYRKFPRRALFERIGMRNTIAGMDRFGNYVLSSQVYTNARDLARFGLLYLNRGKWNGDQIVPETWVDFSRTPAPATRNTGRQYGAHWWLVPDSRTDLPQDAYSTSGARGQYTIVVPSYNLVVVRRGLDWREGNRGLSQWDLLAEVLKAFPRKQGGTKPQNATE